MVDIVNQCGICLSQIGMLSFCIDLN